MDRPWPFRLKNNISDVCTVQRWEQTDKNGKTYKYIDRDCSDEKAAKEKAGKKNCNDVKIDFTGDKYEACWSICEGNLCNDARAVFGSMILMAMMIWLWFSKMCSLCQTISVTSHKPDISEFMLETSCSSK